MDYRGPLATSTVALVALVVAASVGCATSPVDAEFSRDDSLDPGREAGTTQVFRADAATGCENLQCRQVDCGKGPPTTLSGIVYDPAGVTPLYDVIVYVPNAELAPMTHGVSCDTCGARPTGAPR